ncbi:MAG: phage portal protein [Hyphomonas sp.]|uniref:phage portal protein n=1 Tax=Hyphomonas sp. TaxID=87 RepID=UPI0025C3223B|nr:phage portal protein [Hyphomonas sp.]MBA4337786.1 phage portal protein [Hyphomonas sp.]
MARVPRLSEIAQLFRDAPKPRVRSFDGATGGRRGWGVGTAGPINPEVGAAGERLRARARYLAQNNPWIANAVANWTASLAGAGIMANSAHPDAATRARLDSEFTLWSDDADADGRTDWYGLQAAICRALIVDGESFVQKIQTRDGVQLRLIPAEQCDWSLTREGLASGGYIVNGVEFNADGRRVAYHIHPARPTALYPTYEPAVRIDAVDICHVFKPLAPGQVRGVSWLAPVILQAGEFDQLCDALLVGAKVAAMHAGFITDQNATGAVSLDGTPGDLSEASLEPGVIRLLPAGTDIKFSTPAQTNEVSAFLRLNLQSLAAGLGLPEHMLSGDLSNANYSSLRAGLLPFRARVEQIQYGILVPQLLRPVWRRVIGMGVLSGTLEASDFESAQRDYLAVEWIMPRPMQVDPAKDVQATRDMLDAGLMSRRQAVAEQGWNVETLDAEIAADKAREAELGLTFGKPKESPNGN